MLGAKVARRPRCVLRKIIRQSAWDLVTAAVWAFIDEASIPFPVDPCARNVEWIAHRVEEEGGVVLLHINLYSSIRHLAQNVLVASIFFVLHRRRRCTPIKA